MRTLEFLGLDEKKVQYVVKELSVLLADLQVYYSNLRGFHWDVKGHGFFVMHSKYEELYNDAAEKVDEVAVRRRAVTVLICRHLRSRKLVS